MLLLCHYGYYQVFIRETSTSICKNCLAVAREDSERCSSTVQMDECEFYNLGGSIPTSISSMRVKLSRSNISCPHSSWACSFIQLYQLSLNIVTGSLQLIIFLEYSFFNINYILYWNAHNWPGTVNAQKQKMVLSSSLPLLIY